MNSQPKVKQTKKQLQKPRGTKDIFGFESFLKQELEDNLRLMAELYNYQKLETPIFEHTEVFKRSVGLTSDIVVKELFEFNDKKERNLSLRPEGTAPAVRALLENNLLNLLQFKKVYYQGPMFRYENPQLGRQRQFNQFGVENFSPISPYIDAELIIMAYQILNNLGVKSKLMINSLGDKTSRQNYSHALKEYLKPFKTKLSQFSQQRLNTNPLRILDDKLESQKDFIKSAPKISDYLSNDSQVYFSSVLKILDSYQIDYEVNNTLVRGLDYYTDTIFEFLPFDNLDASQGTLIAGGRFDHLVSEMGGPNISGVGFALGVERILNILKQQVTEESIQSGYLIYVASLTETALDKAFEIMLNLRENNFKVEWNVQPQKLLKIFNQTKNLKIKAFIILGEKELKLNQLTLKIGNQNKVIKMSELIDVLNKQLA